MLSKLHANRLRKLALHIIDEKKRGHKTFDYAVMNANFPEGTRFADCLADNLKYAIIPPSSACGTNGCAIGECPIAFKRSWRFCVDGVPRLRRASAAESPFDSAAAFFGVSIHDANWLFDPGYNRLEDCATAKQVSRHILKYVKEHTHAVKTPR